MDGIKRWFRFPLPCAGKPFPNKIRRVVNEALTPLSESANFLKLGAKLREKAEAYDEVVGWKEKHGTLSKDSPDAPIDSGLPPHIALSILHDGVVEALQSLDKIATLNVDGVAFVSSAEVTVARERLTVALTTSGLVVKLNEERRKRAGKTDDGSDDSDD
ncbi:hypothetical protein FACS1894103_4850 [Campylobacterota bacterium]|nr:hypothetical protein FACS1894103_4850 [Campylobacterota bacterium]